MTSGLFGLLTLVSLALMLVSATVAAIYVRQLCKRESTAISDELGSARSVIRAAERASPSPCWRCSPAICEK